MRTITRYTLHSVVPAMAAAVVVVAGLGGLVGVALELLRAPVRPSLSALPGLLLVALPLTWSAALPLAAMLGLSGALWRWRRDGQWSALRASGVGGGQLLRAALPLALGLSLGVAGLTHGVEPAARAATQAALRASLEVVPGRLVQLGGLSLVAEVAEGETLEGLAFAWEDPGQLVSGAAARGRLEADALVLEQGRLLALGASPVQVDFERLRLRLERPEARVERTERSSAALRDLVQRMEAKGRDASHERATLLRRWSWPLAAGLLLLACPPLALSRRLLPLAALPVAYWSLVRAADGLTLSLGGGLAAWGPTAALAALVAALWWRWEER